MLLGGHCVPVIACSCCWAAFCRTWVVVFDSFSPCPSGSEALTFFKASVLLLKNLRSSSLRCLPCPSLAAF